MNDLTLAGNLLTSPSAAFAELQERPRFLTPLLLLCGATIAMVCWYYLAVDFEWAKDHMMSANPRFQSMPEADRTRMMSAMTFNRMVVSSTVGAVVVVAIVMALQGFYLWLAGKISNVQYSYKHWFSFVAWCGLPSVLGAVTGMVVLAMQGSNFQIGMESLQVLSLNELFFHRTNDQPGFTLLSSLNLLSIWSWFLLVTGVHVWSRRSWAFSAFFALLPYIAIYGVMAWFAFK